MWRCLFRLSVQTRGTRRPALVNPMAPLPSTTITKRSGVPRKAYGRRDPQVVPEARPEVSSRPESRGQVGRGALQERPGSLRHPERPEEARRCTTSSASIPRTAIPARGAPGARAVPAARQPPNMDFGGFDFSDYSQPARPEAEPDRQDRRAEGGGGFRDIFSQFFGGRPKRSPAAEPEKGADLEYVMDIDFWQAIRAPRRASTSPATKSAPPATARDPLARGEVTCPQCKGTGQCHPDGRRHEVQPHLSALRRHGKLQQCLPHLRRRWPRGQDRDRRGPHSRRARERLAPARRRQGQRRHHGRASRAISTSPPRGAHPFFHREGDNIEIKVPVAVLGSGTRRQDRSADHRRPHACSRFRQGTRTARNSACAKRVSSTRAPNQRGDQIVEVAIQAPESATMRRTRSCCANSPNSIPKIRARNSGTQGS